MKTQNLEKGSFSKNKTFINVMHIHLNFGHKSLYVYQYHAGYILLNQTQ